MQKALKTVLSSDSPMIELTDICRTFMVGDQPVHALDHVNLTVNKGDYLSIMGPSGSGKSTLLNVLGLLDRPDSGHYRLNGVATETLAEPELARLRHDTIGFVFQAYHLIGRLTALENVEVPLMLSGVPRTQRREAAKELLVRLGLENRLNHFPAQLSGGQRQRVAIARALVTRPALILADEPTGNLDSRSGEEVIALLERFNAEGLTLIIVTHDPAIGARARRHVRMVDGRLSEDKIDDLHH